MTFDEVLDEMNANQEPSESIRFMEQLRDIYAPTVEMTKEQYHSFKLWKYHTAGWNMTNCAEWAGDEKITATNAMQAWLHPETIKIVE